jgi:hypothetical protein
VSCGTQTYCPKDNSCSNLDTTTHCGDCDIACTGGLVCVGRECVSRQLDGGPLPE